MAAQYTNVTQTACVSPDQFKIDQALKNCYNLSLEKKNKFSVPVICVYSTSTPLHIHVSLNYKIYIKVLLCTKDNATSRDSFFVKKVIKSHFCAFIFSPVAIINEEAPGTHFAVRDSLGVY